jgi:hypothetical protein
VQADRIPRAILDTRSALYTPKVHNSPGRLEKELAFIQDRVSWMVQTLEHPEHDPPMLSRHQGRFAELLLVDEATGSRPPPWNSCVTGTTAPAPVGFVHHFRVLSAEEQAFVLARNWPELGLHDAQDFTTAEALATIIRITSGNFRLTARPVAQIKRVLDINHLTVVTAEHGELLRQVTPGPDRCPQVLALRGHPGRNRGGRRRRPQARATTRPATAYPRTRRAGSPALIFGGHRGRPGGGDRLHRGVD